MSKVEKLKAELALAEAEAAFVAAKENKDKKPAEYVEAKRVLRELRQDYRENHRRPPAGKGAAAPSPASVKGKVG